MKSSCLQVMLVLACFVPTLACAQEQPIAGSAKETMPLETGEKIPDVQVIGLDEQEVALSSLHQEKPLIIVFFRGGWCPICTKHTQELIKVYPKIQELGYELVGISPDSVQSSKVNVEKTTIPFPIYSDAELKAIRAFGLAFKVDDETVTKYKGYGIDLAKASGQDHNSLPIPAVYIVGIDGVVTFAHSNPDYTKRLGVKELLKEIAK